MIGDRLRQARLAKGLTLDQVSVQLGALDQPMTKAGLSRYEHNNSTPPPTLLLKLACVLGVTSRHFLQELGGADSVAGIPQASALVGEPPGTPQGVPNSGCRGADVAAGDADDAPTAKALLERPAEERSRVLATAAAAAVPLYRDDPDLTGFDAFGEDDLYDYPD